MHVFLGVMDDDTYELKLNGENGTTNLTKAGPSRLYQLSHRASIFSFIRPLTGFLSELPADQWSADSAIHEERGISAGAEDQYVT